MQVLRHEEFEKGCEVSLLTRLPNKIRIYRLQSIYKLLKLIHFDIYIYNII